MRSTVISIMNIEKGNLVFESDIDFKTPDEEGAVAKNHVILTCPHCACDPHTKVRQCDTMAHRALASLHRAFLKYPSIEVHDVVNSGVPRSFVDMNRPEARGTEYREILKQTIVALRSIERRRLVLFDCHSYPRWHTWGKPGPPPDMVILSNIDGRYDWSGMTSAGIYMVDGSPANDIVETARNAYGIFQSTILEYREDLTEGRLEEINARVAEYVVRKVFNE